MFAYFSTISIGEKLCYWFSRISLGRTEVCSRKASKLNGASCLLNITICKLEIWRHLLLKSIQLNKTDKWNGTHEKSISQLHISTIQMEMKMPKIVKYHFPITIWNKYHFYDSCTNAYCNIRHFAIFSLVWEWEILRGFVDDKAFTMIHKNRRGNRFSYQRIVVETKILLLSKRAHRIRSHIAFNLSIEKSIHFLPCWLISYACSFYKKELQGGNDTLSPKLFIVQSMLSTAPFKYSVFAWFSTICSHDILKAVQNHTFLIAFYHERFTKNIFQCFDKNSVL